MHLVRQQGGTGTLSIACRSFSKAMRWLSNSGTAFRRSNIHVIPGQVDWDEPSDRIHRAVNVGDGPYEEITVFFLGHPDDVPQPDAP